MFIFGLCSIYCYIFNFPCRQLRFNNINENENYSLMKFLFSSFLHEGAKGGLAALDLLRANWQKVSRKGDFPSTRCGSAVTMYKSKALLFGGVFDDEG